MNKGIKLGLVLALLGSHIFCKETTEPSILGYFGQALQHPKFVLPISAYNQIVSNYFLPDAPQAHYPDALLNTGDIQQIIRSAHATYADLAKQPWLNATCPTFKRGQKNGYIHKTMLPPGARVLFLVTCTEACRHWYAYCANL